MLYPHSRNISFHSYPQTRYEEKKAICNAVFLLMFDKEVFFYHLVFFCSPIKKHTPHATVVIYHFIS